MLRVGDLMFVWEPFSPIAQAIGRFQYPVEWKNRDVDWSHVQGVSEVLQSSFRVISADAPPRGVVENEIVPLSPNLFDVVHPDGSKIRVFGDYAFLSYRSISDTKRSELIAKARTQIGKPYDVPGLGSFVLHKDVNNPDAWFCSELWKWSSDEIGCPIVERVKSSWTPPNLLWVSAVLEEVHL
jgi:hypothetical protein